MSKCSVNGCGNQAEFLVVLYDFYLDGSLFTEMDSTCPRICGTHAIANEQEASGPRVPRTRTNYPFTNQDGAQGITIYLPLTGFPPPK